MQSSLNRCFISTLAGVAVLGSCAALAVSYLPHANWSVSFSTFAKGTAEDDRGSGRLVQRFLLPGSLQSFRGSGRVSPAPPPAPAATCQNIFAYRGTGRLGENATSA
jgi:hypothetical protein